MPSMTKRRVNRRESVRPGAMRLTPDWHSARCGVHQVHTRRAGASTRCALDAPERQPGPHSAGRWPAHNAGAVTIGRVTLRRMLLLAVVIIAIALVGAVWIWVRAQQAADALADARSGVSNVRDSITSGDTAKANEQLAVVQGDPARAVNATSDPVFAIASALPIVGNTPAAV